MKRLQYDEARKRIQELSEAGGEQRCVDWLGDFLGVARGRQNRVEIFLPGPPVDTRLPIVSAAITHGLWSRPGEEGPFAAARLLLPPGPQYDEIAATVCVELDRAGVASERQAAFAKCEPLIEIALSHAALASDAVLGLFGELYLLLFWIRRAGETFEGVLDGWRGFGPSYRDFSAGVVGVEVKSTLGPNSSHSVAGVHQVEPTPSDQNPSEGRLILVSIGLSMQSTGLSVLDLVRGIDDFLRSRVSALADEFQTHVSDYGGRSTGYRPGNENQPALLSRQFGINFVRAYDMSDPGIYVLKLEDIQQHPHVQTDSVKFRINLPAQVSGDVNPTVGISKVIARLEALRKANG